MAGLQLRYHTVIVPITPEAAHCTCYTHSPAHMYMQQWIQRHSANVRCWQHIWHTRIHRLPPSLKSGCLLHSTRQVTYQSDKRCLCANTQTYTRNEKNEINTWTMLGRPAKLFLYDNGAWHTTSSADLKTQTASKQREQREHQQNGPRCEQTQPNVLPCY